MSRVAAPFVKARVILRQRLIDAGDACTRAMAGSFRLSRAARHHASWPRELHRGALLLGASAAIFWSSFAVGRWIVSTVEFGPIYVDLLLGWVAVLVHMAAWPNLWIGLRDLRGRQPRDDHPVIAWRSFMITLVMILAAVVILPIEYHSLSSTDAWIFVVYVTSFPYLGWTFVPILALRGVLDERLDPAQALGKDDHLEPPEALDDLCGVSHFEAQHATEASHLLLRDPMTWVLRQPGIVDLRDPLVAREDPRHRPRVVAMPFHADRERLDPAEGEPTVERTGDRAERVLGESQLLVQVLAVRDDGSPEEVGMATDVLRRTVDDQVHAQPERVLQRGRPERVVADADRVMGFRDHGELLQVDDLHQRVRRGFHPDHLRFGSEGILHVHQIAEVQEG